MSRVKDVTPPYTRQFQVTLTEEQVHIFMAFLGSIATTSFASDEMNGLWSDLADSLGQSEKYVTVDVAGNNAVVYFAQEVVGDTTTKELDSLGDQLYNALNEYKYIANRAIEINLW